ncbi:cation transporter [Pseudoflavonifractor phocaeensis]|uniref:cation diffusion facilitator family transporter n=1 Tax=Pseudoflavonifractor phocaeensis TaxID=1870988 RepID=UPI00195979E9|nr:cation diffusion facilitator family transporter [Pseudoflavonifractor phocaeensis]MBM6871451.1 cation transporter [Pseudoflavonifractor phocaeensis]MBM6938292.1 cation transporter [Pseudoflavonifractor phocaeensis]
MTQLLLRLFVRDYQQTKDPEVRTRYGLLSGVVGIVLNLLLSGGKFLAGTLSGSISITADAFNNLTDAGSSVVTLVGFHMAGQKADDDHPFGHGRVEYLAGLLVAGIILLVGFELAKSSVDQILHPEEVRFSWVSAGVLAASIAVKLWMSLFNRGLSRRIDSAAMAATAADSLSDVAATSAVLLGGIVGALTHLPIDGWAGLLVSVFILRAGLGAAKDTIDPLLGKSADPELVRDIEKTVLSHQEVVGIHDLVIHDYGPGRSMMSLHAEVPMNADIMEAHDAIDHIERELKDKYHILTSIHMDPIATDDSRVTEMRTRVADLVKEIDETLTIHDFRMTDGPDHTNLIFDVVAPHRFSLSDEALVEEIQRRVRTLGERYFAVVQVDHSFVEG